MAIFTCPRDFFGKSINNVFCGASIITDKHVITAAHCTKMCASRDNLTLQVGLIDRKSKNIISHDIEEVFEHDNSREGLNDLAVVRTKKKINFSSVVKPICLAVSWDKFRKREKECQIIFIKLLFFSKGFDHGVGQI